MLAAELEPRLMPILETDHRIKCLTNAREEGGRGGWVLLQMTDAPLTGNFPMYAFCNGLIQYWFSLKLVSNHGMYSISHIHLIKITLFERSNQTIRILPK